MMGGAFAIERRDPAAGVLQLGSALARASRERVSGLVEVRDRQLIHRVWLRSGKISGIELMDGDRLLMGSSPGRAQQRLERLFCLSRPHVLWSEDLPTSPGTDTLDPAPIIIGGVARRADLFEPRHLVERIPVNTLRLEPDRLPRARGLPLAPEEIAFLERLRVPTPIPMALWKRGLDPHRAGTLVVALNLIGLWEGWRPGQLPRLTTAARVTRAVSAGRPDHAILGVAPDATREVIDRSFRRLSLELHPDRHHWLPAGEAAQARAAFEAVATARDNLRRSRRSRPARSADEPSAATGSKISPSSPGWAPLLHEARQAWRSGRAPRARAFALKALAQSPPPPARAELASLLARAS